MERHSLAFFIGYRVRLPDVDEPLPLFCQFSVDPGDKTTERHSFPNGFLSEGAASGAFHHGSADIVGSDDGVVGGRGGVHHECFVKTGMINGIASVPDVDHGSLRERRQQFVGGLGREDRRTRRLLAVRYVMHGEAIVIHGVEAGVAVPRFVEMEPIHTLTEEFFHPFHIVAQAVIGGVGHDSVDGVSITGGRVEGVIPHGSLDGLGRQAMGRDGTDEAVMVAGWQEIGGDGSGHGNGMLNGFMAVAVAESRLIARHAGHEDNTVGRGGAIRHVVGPVRAEHTSGVGLALANRTGVIQQRTEFTHRNGQVRTEDVFAEKVEERPA